MGVAERMITIMEYILNDPSGLLSCGVGLILILCFLNSLYSPVGRSRYVSPTAKYIRPGVIEIRGDVVELQGKNFGIPCTWVHLGYKHWRMETHTNEPETQEFATYINS